MYVYEYTVILGQHLMLKEAYVTFMQSKQKIVKVDHYCRRVDVGQSSNIPIHINYHDWLLYSQNGKKM